jgi:hypothetical protein
VSETPFAPRFHGFPEPGGDLRRTLDFINELTTEAHARGDGLRRHEALVQLLLIALQATRNLNGLVDPKSDDPVTRQFIEDLVSSQHHWPIPYNEVEELSRYDGLRIGYLAVPSRNPKKRTGATVFSEYALALVLKLRVLRAQHMLTLPDLDSDLRSACELRVRAYAAQWSQGVPVKEALKQPFRAIALYRPREDASFGRLPELSPETAAEWRSAAVQLLVEALPPANQLIALADQISDADVTTEAQIRARIHQRVGRAVIALAK